MTFHPNVNTGCADILMFIYRSCVSWGPQISGRNDEHVTDGETNAGGTRRVQQQLQRDVLLDKDIILKVLQKGHRGSVGGIQLLLIKTQWTKE